MWFILALASSIFAALTSILAKIGIDGVNSNLATAIRTLVVLIMSWGMVFLTNAQGGITEISRRSWVFLVLSGLATGAYNEPINIEEYAQSRGMSVSWFLRNFKQILKQSPMQYLLSIRINNAASLLETTDYNITEISTIVGYDNPLYFSRLFRKQKGLSPSAYRKAMTGKSDEA